MAPTYSILNGCTPRSAGPTKTLAMTKDQSEAPNGTRQCTPRSFPSENGVVFESPPFNTWRRRTHHREKRRGRHRSRRLALLNHAVVVLFSAVYLLDVRVELPHLHLDVLSMDLNLLWAPFEGRRVLLHRLRVRVERRRVALVLRHPRANLRRVPLNRC